MIIRIEHTTITVSDLKRSVDFYTRLLGFSVSGGMHFPESNLEIVFLDLGDTTLELFGVPATQGRMVNDVNEVIGYKHICLRVDSVDAEFARLSAAGVVFRIPPTTVQSSVRIAFFHDPDGMDIELLEALPKDTQ
jgi:glyoxylase I family protein